MYLYLFICANILFVIKAQEFKRFLFPEDEIAIPPNPNQPILEAITPMNPIASNTARQSYEPVTGAKTQRRTKPPKQYHATPPSLLDPVPSIQIGDQYAQTSNFEYIPVPGPLLSPDPIPQSQSDAYQEQQPYAPVRPNIGSGRPAYPLVGYPEEMIEDQKLKQQTPGYPYPHQIVNTPSTVVKESYEINYCDGKEFPTDSLANHGLERIDYFVYNRSCSKIFFQCAIGQTFILKCPSDDQAFDPETVNCNFRNSVKLCPEYDHVMHCTIRESCTANQFACCAPTQQCLDLQRRCDGKPDCSDGEDENNCPSCARNEFACVKSGRCIPSSQRCDEHEDDCGDGSNLDEIGCTKNTTCWGKFVCDSRETINLLGRSDCIDYERHCDGYKDCPGGEDEINCRLTDAKYLLCENQKQSVRKDQWCDGVEHCADGSDEKYCY